MTLTLAYHDSFVRVQELLRPCAPHSQLYNDIYLSHSLLGLLCVCVPWLFRMYARTLACVCHDSLVCVRLSLNSTTIFISATLSHDSCVCVPWLFRMYARTLACMCHDSLVCVHLRCDLKCLVCLSCVVSNVSFVCHSCAPHFKAHADMISSSRVYDVRFFVCVICVSFVCTSV